MQRSQILDRSENFEVWIFAREQWEAFSKKGHTGKWMFLSHKWDLRIRTLQGKEEASFQGNIIMSDDRKFQEGNMENLALVWIADTKADFTVYPDLCLLTQKFILLAKKKKKTQKLIQLHQ